MPNLENLHTLLCSPDQANRELGWGIYSGLGDSDKRKVDHRLQREKRKFNEDVFWGLGCDECPLFGNTGPGKCPLPIQAIAVNDPQISVYIATQIGISRIDAETVEFKSKCGKRDMKPKKREPKGQFKLF